MSRPRKPDEDIARERIANALRAAWGSDEDATLEDETRRLMLHLSQEREANAESGLAGEPPAAPEAKRRRLLGRLLGKRRR